MIIIEAGKQDAKSFDAKILFATQLSYRGHAVAMDENTAPESIARFQKYEIAHLLTNISYVDVSGLILIGAEEITDETLIALRAYDLGSEITISATGRFPDLQSLIGTTSKLAFAFGREVNVVDLNDIQKSQILRTSISPLAASVIEVKRNITTPLEVFVYLPPEWLEEPAILSALGSMNYFSAFKLNIIVSGKGKEVLRTSKFSEISVFGLVDLSPATFSGIADIAVFYGDSVPGDRMASFALDLMKSGGTVIDCTGPASFIASGAPVLRGPEDLPALANYLEQVVLANISEIGHQTKDSDWLEQNSIERLEAALDLPATTKTKAKPEQDTKTVFVPTNGNGLGHAQRCSLVATAIGNPTDCSFAAFPSCISLINSYGFACTPLVQKSPFHEDEYANDLVNYLRLGNLMAPGDNLVFDGGYVFDSIYRRILEKSLNATWIRRGLWRTGQIRQSTLDREKAFQKVIVPAEAFEELNAAYTHGSKVHQVGPIVQQSTTTAKDSANLRSRLRQSLDCEFDELVITMLGGGVAADRSAQMQSLCVQMERRPNCLHLILVWPGSKVSPGLYGWKNSRVVKTKNALALCQASDLVVSAVGYNSYHEILYHGIASILIPQTAPFMDDQEKRARAASDRGLAVTVLATEFLQLEREVSAFLDEGKAEEIRKKLNATALPELGTKAAAAIIGGEV